MRKTVGVMVALTAVSVSVMTGMTIGYFDKNRNEKTDEVEKIKSVVNEEESVWNIENGLSHYSVRIEEDCLLLCEVYKDGEEREIERLEINKSVLPTNDVRVLKDGVAFTNKDEALLLIENFVS